MKREPAIANWLLRLFCSNSKYDAVTGDLLEQYQAGRGNVWYFRQVFDIVCLALYSKVLRRPLVHTHSLPVGQGLSLFLLFCALSSIFVSLAAELLIVLIGIAMTGVVIFLFIGGSDRGQPNKPPAVIVETPYVHPGISLHHIPVEGAVGLLFVIGTVLIFATGVRVLREILLLTIPLGGLGAWLMVYWRRNHPVMFQGLGLKAKARHRS